MTEKKIPCNVIVDLLPLYKEDICSEETKDIVEEHIRGCEDCRQLCETMTVPEIKAKEVPTERETFKKVGKKLKRSRFTKIMSVLMCICLVLFAGVNAAWYFLKYRPMKNLCEGMEKIAPYDDYDDGSKNSPRVNKVTVYSSEDDKYTYFVSMPHYLNFGMGYMLVAPKDAVTVDGNGMIGTDGRGHDITRLIIPHDISRADRVEVGISYNEIYDGQTGRASIVFGMDKEFRTLKDAQNLAPEDTAKLREFIEAHRDELNDMKKAAQNKWGDYLK